MDAYEFVNQLVGTHFCYGIKSTGFDLYDFGLVRANSHLSSDAKPEMCDYILHATCRFKVIWQGVPRHTDTFDEDTTSENFTSKFTNVLGLTVKRTDLSDKNDLWLDLGACWIVFATFEGEEESWCLFVPNQKGPFLSASDSFLEFVN